MWYLTAIFSSLMWGFADALYERTFDDEDNLCSHKYIVFTGLCAFIVSLFCCKFSESGLPVTKLLSLYKSFFLIPLSYVLAIFCEIKALKTVKQSIVSPVSNTSSIFIFVMLVVFYAVMGNKEKALSQISFFSVTGTIIITIGMVLLSKNTESLDNQDKNKYGFLILLLPILGALFEALETVFETLLIDDVVEEGIGTIDFIRLYSFFVIIIALCFWTFISVKEKHVYFIRQKQDFGYLITSFCEYLVLIPYCLALDRLPFFTAVVSSVYSVFTIIFCKLLNGTVLTKKQYSIISVIIFGIILFSFH